MRTKILIIAIIILITLTGCNTNKLECTKEQNSATIKINATFNKENNNIETLKFNQKTIYDKFNAYIDLHYYELKESYSSLDNINGITYDVKENKNDITINLNVDYNKLPNINNILIPIDKNSNIEIAKQKLINNGYTCK